MAHVYSALRISVLTKTHSLDAVLLLFIKQGCCVFGIEDQRCVYAPYVLLFLAMSCRFWENK